MSGQGPVWGLVAFMMVATILGAYLFVTRFAAPFMRDALDELRTLAKAVNRNSNYLRRLMGFMQGKGDDSDLDEHDSDQTPPMRR